jgi:hypothetical protein
LVFRTNNTEQVRLDTNGNFGIGTVSPTARLHVNGTIRFQGLPTTTSGNYLVVDNTGNVSVASPTQFGDQDWIVASNNGGTGGPEASNQIPTNLDQWIYTNGRVGIGTSNPTESLHVHDGHLILTNSDDTARELRLYEPSGAGTNFTALRAQAQTSNITYTLPASLTATSTIATGLLQTDANGNLSWLNPTGLNSIFWSLTGNTGTNPNNNFLGTNDAQPLVIRTSNTERMRIGTNGNVGIGTTTPGRRLDVVDELSVNNNLLTQIEGGLYYGRVRVSENQWALSNVGATWTERTGAGLRGWISVSLSSDGKYQTAVVWGGYIYTSSDYGATWTERTDAGSRAWYSVSLSSDGKYQTAVEVGGYIYTSSDYGATWTERTGAGSRYWRSVSLSSDGKYQTAVEVGGYIYTSSDYGATWTERTGAGFRNWQSVSLSSDGKYQTAVVTSIDGEYIYTSSDYGATWTERTGAGARNWQSVSLSSDGKYQTAVAYNGYIYTSSDYGATWTERTGAGARNWQSVSLSSDGKYQTAVVTSIDGEYIYTSSDYGATWTERTGAGARNWQSVSLSSDGKYQTAVAYGGYIYTSSADSYIFGGNVGIGTEAPSEKLHVVGNFMLVNNGASIAYKDGTATWSNPSDARLKTNIQPITNALEKITKLRGVSFDWINQDLHQGDAKSGFLAQEMEQVFPDCVQEVEVDSNSSDAKLVGDGKIKTVGLTTGFFASIVEAIKEQQQMIEELQQELAILRQENAYLKQTLKTEIQQLQQEINTLKSKLPE